MLLRSFRALLVVAAVVAWSLPAAANDVSLKIAIGTPVVLASQPSRAYLKVGLTGAEVGQADRAGVNLAIVLDRSQSMHGEKLVKAKDAALSVLDKLRDDDVISVIAYGSEARVLVPASNGSERQLIRDQIEAVEPGGSTALFAGLSKGLEEVRKFKSDQRVNRVIILSDGQANIGPRSPNQLARLGAAAQKEGISISTVGLGLGYNEDLMAQLAFHSGGNHAFAESPDQLATNFRYELSDIFSVVAQDVRLRLYFKNGARPLRVLNRPGEVHGELVVLGLNHLYAAQEKFFLLEVDVPAGRTGTVKEIASVELGYRSLPSRERQAAMAAVGVQYTSSPVDVVRWQNRDVMIAAVEAVATQRSREAVTLRDRGLKQEALRLLQLNEDYLLQNAATFQSDKLRSYGAQNASDAANLDAENWVKQRKVMRQRQVRKDTQQDF